MTLSELTDMLGYTRIEVLKVPPASDDPNKYRLTFKGEARKTPKELLDLNVVTMSENRHHVVIYLENVLSSFLCRVPYESDPRD